jgi:hypothetical protein
LSVVPGVPAQGKTIPETPTRILIQWDKPGAEDHVGWFRVDRSIDRAGATARWEQIKRVYAKSDDPSDTNFDTTEATDEKPGGWLPDPKRDAPRYRVCAQNSSGESCSRVLWTVSRFANPPVLEQSAHIPSGTDVRPSSRVGNLGRFLEPAPPVLLEPPVNAHVPIGELHARIDTPVGGGTMVEFALSRGEESVPWRVKMAAAVAGIVLPAELTNGQPGKWRLTARVVEPFDGPVSAPVEIELTDAVENASRPAAGSAPPRARARVVVPH